MSNIFDDISKAVSKVNVGTIAGNAITYIKITSAYGPDIFIPKPFAPATTTKKDPLLAAIQPRIEVGLSGGDKPLIYRPYGDPPPTKWPYVAALSAFATVVLVGGTLYLTYRIAKGRSVDGLSGFRSKARPRLRGRRRR